MLYPVGAAAVYAVTQSSRMIPFAERLSSSGGVEKAMSEPLFSVRHGPLHRAGGIRTHTDAKSSGF
jgi:hypothetical protein